MASTSNFVQGKDGKPVVPPSTTVTPQVTTAPAAVSAAPARKFETVVEKEEPKNIQLRLETPLVVVTPAKAEPAEEEVYIPESTLLEMQCGRDTLARKRTGKLSSFK